MQRQEVNNARRFEMLNVTSLVIGFVGLLLLSSVCAGTPNKSERPWSIFAYGGKWSDNRVGEITRLQTENRSSYIWATGISREIHRFNDNLLMETEFVLARHSGLQENWECNAAVNLRWETFPWDDYVNSTFSYGLGFSYAFGDPVIEEEDDQHTHRLLFSMPIELTLAPPAKYDPSWDFFIRIHHRSGGYGIIADNQGSNFLTSGLRYHF
ncbi:MAG: hypothetical protein ACLFWL_02305 [Candidatus Brocadiia bacterium]